MKPNLLAASAVALALASTVFASGANAQQLAANGDFSTGDFTGWTFFTDNGGGLGFPPDPQVTLFDMTGGGPMNAAEFEVGAGVFYQPGGGGIAQSITTASGDFNFNADIAAYNPGAFPNLEAGAFSVLIDGGAVASNTLWTIAPGQILRSTLSFDTSISAGSHTLSILIDRNYINDFARGETPFEYIGDVCASNQAGYCYTAPPPPPPPAPEPGTWAMMLLGFAGLGAALRSRRGSAALVQGGA
jgi:hypothetical protein